VLHRGKVLAEGPFQDIANNEMVRNIYLGRGTCAVDGA